VKGDRETRDRLLRAAGTLFADHGFRRVTVREICGVAKANVAAVNYHFGDKLGLYREVMQSAIDAMRATSDEARAAGEGQAPEEKLRRYVAVFLRRLLTTGHDNVHRLVHREMSDPTPALDALIEHGMRPRIEYLSGIVAEIMDRPPSDKRVLRCVASIQSQSVAYLPNPIAARLGIAFDPTPANIRKAAHHVTTFSIAGVRAVGRSRR
jgi:AcrR family transcriptional regulator